MVDEHKISKSNRRREAAATTFLLTAFVLWLTGFVYLYG
jgi:hypothetical protein